MPFAPNPDTSHQPTAAAAEENKEEVERPTPLLLRKSGVRSGRKDINEKKRVDNLVARRRQKTAIYLLHALALVVKDSRYISDPRD